MQSNTELDLKKQVKFVKFTDAANETSQEWQNSEDLLGGIIKRGQLGWHAMGSKFSIFSQKTGNSISQFCFDANLGLENSLITCMCEVDVHFPNGCLMAVGVQYGDSPGGLIAVFSVENSKILRCIEIKDKITSCHFVNADICNRTVLDIMQGCLAVGTDTGSILLVDLNLKKCEEAYLSYNNNLDDVQLVPSHVIDESSIDIPHLRQHYLQSQQEDVNIAIHLEEVQNAGLVLCLQSVTPMLSLVAGVEDGRMLIYDLSELQLFIVINPPKNLSPLVRCAFMEPPDDPKPCIYIWAMHENAQCSVAVMHTLLYHGKCVEDDGVAILENFEKTIPRLSLPMSERGCIPLSCQSVSRSVSNGDEETISLCVMTWKMKGDLEILVFDISQWYKEEMPVEGNWQSDPSYLASFKLKGSNPLDISIDASTIALFNSIQRPEEHFYPVSLSFDLIALQNNDCLYLHWSGLQNRAISMLSCGGPLAILEPSTCFNEILSAFLLPQFCDQNYSSTFSVNSQREILLSVAIEHNCFGLLKECAKHWADGSHLGKNTSEGLSLSTLTDWIWKRAGSIKSRCNFLSTSLFNFSGLTLCPREQKEMTLLSRQLKLLGDLLELIITKWKQNIPKSAMDVLCSQNKSIHLSSEYQDVLLWLLNIGLLPEAKNSSSETNSSLVPYPYTFLKQFYDAQRKSIQKLNDNFVHHRTGSCRVLFIDSFIDHECSPNVLRDYWQESGGNGLYPPPSLQAMLRTLLIPDVSFQKKCALFLYFFLDLNNAIEDDNYANIVQSFIKFPTVFKLPAALIKTIQSFWYLDHGQYQIAVEEIISPFYRDQKLSQWQFELLIESLLAQNEPNFALRALQVAKSQISPVLELKTLLVNDLIPEAFHFARSKNNVEIMKVFFSGCLFMHKYSVLRDLALTDDEGKLVIDMLRSKKSQQTDNLHLVYLLQKSKYIEALNYLEELSKRRANVDTPSLVLSAYNLTMSPMARDLSDIYYKIKNRIKDKELQNAEPLPLSSQLIQNNANNLLGGIYQSSALGAHYATYYWDEMDAEKSHIRSANNAPFVRRPQEDMLAEGIFSEQISYPEAYKPAQKRRIEEEQSELIEVEKSRLENPTKRRKVFESSLKESVSVVSNVSQIRSKPELRPINPQVSAKVTSSALLSTPFVKDVRSDLLGKRYPDQGDKSSTLPGILKVRGDSQLSVYEDKLNTSDGSHRNESADDDKSIRFDLPMEQEEAVEEEEEQVVIEKPRFSLQSSSASHDLSCATNEHDFFSPLSSRDNSKYMDTEETCAPDPKPQAADKLCVLSPLRRRSDEIKPRRPIRGESMERSVSRSRSSTPEVEMKPKPQPVNAQLSRRVLEANLFAKKPTVDIDSGAPQLTKTLTKLDTHNFQPFVSSSKITDSETRFVEKTVVETHKISECSTIVGGVTFTESYNKVVTTEKSIVPGEKKQALANLMDTTVDMTMGDITSFGPVASIIDPEPISSHADTEAQFVEESQESCESPLMFYSPSSVATHYEETAADNTEEELKTKFDDIVARIDGDNFEETTQSKDKEMASSSTSDEEEEDDDDSKSTGGESSILELLVENDFEEGAEEEETPTEQIVIESDEEDDDDNEEEEGEESSDGDDDDSSSVNTISSTSRSVTNTSSNTGSNAFASYMPSDMGLGRIEATSTMISGLGRNNTESAVITIDSDSDEEEVAENVEEQQEGPVEVEEDSSEIIDRVDGPADVIKEEQNLSEVVNEEEDTTTTETETAVESISEEPADIEMDVQAEEVDVDMEVGEQPEQEQSVTEEKPNSESLPEQASDVLPDTLQTAIASTSEEPEDMKTSTTASTSVETISKEPEDVKTTATTSTSVESDNTALESTATTSKGPEEVKSSESSPKISDVQEEPTTPLKRGMRTRRARSVLIDNDEALSVTDSPSVQRSLRGGSVPRLPSLDAQSKFTKTKGNDAIALDKIEENTVLDSPATRLRTRKRLDSTETEPVTPLASTSKRTRLSSISETPDVSTPIRRTRRASATSDQVVEEVKTPRVTRRRNSVLEEASEQPADVTTTTRVTRRNSVVADAAEQPEVGTTTRITRRRNSTLEEPPVVGTPRTLRRKSTAAEEVTPRISSRRVSTASSRALSVDLSPQSSLIEDATEEEPPVAATPRTLRRRSTAAEDVTPRISSRRVSTASSRAPSVDLSPNSTILENDQTEAAIPSTPRSVRGGSKAKEVASKLKREESDVALPTTPRSVRGGSKAKEVGDESSTKADLLSSSRRLTRTQLGVLEKAMSANPGISPTLEASVSKKHVESAISPNKDSDNESVVSKKSVKSNTSGTRRVTRRSQKEDNDDAISVASSTKSTRGRKRAARAETISPDVSLGAIPEEGSESESVRSSESSAPAKKSRGRPRKN